MKNQRILHIDAWRCFAVLAVIASHIIRRSSDWYIQHLPWMIIPRFDTLGHFGVEIFFCISGFVICRGLILEKENVGSVNMTAFYVRRSLRILPPLSLYLLGVAILTFKGIADVSALQFFYASFFACNLTSACGWFVGHTWSLAYEEQFYLLFPMLFVGSAVFGGRKLFVGLTFALFFVSVFGSMSGFVEMARLTTEFSYMLAGCVTAMYWDVLEPRLSQLTLKSWLTIFSMLFVFSVLILWPPAIEPLLHGFLKPVGICACIFATPTQFPSVRRIFLNPVLIYIGKISFTIYLWQEIATARNMFSSPFGPFAAVCCVVLIAALSYRFLEKPIIALGASLTARLAQRKRVSTLSV